MQLGVQAQHLLETEFFHYVFDYLLKENLQAIVNTDPDQEKERNLLYFEINGMKGFKERIEDLMNQANSVLQMKQREVEDDDD